MTRTTFYLLSLLLLAACADDPYADLSDGELAFEQQSGLDLATDFDAEHTEAVLQSRDRDRYLSIKTYDPERQAGILIQLSLPRTGSVVGEYPVSGDNALLYTRTQPMMEVYGSATCRPARAGRVVITDYEESTHALSGTFEGAMCAGGYQGSATEIAVSRGRFKAVAAIVIE